MELLIVNEVNRKIKEYFENAYLFILQYIMTSIYNEFEICYMLYIKVISEVIF